MSVFDGFVWVPRRSSKALVIAALALLQLLVMTPSIAAVIYGRITLSQGGAVRSKQIQLNGKVVGQTDESGNYQLNLPPGSYTLRIEGRDVLVIVPPTGIKNDIVLPPH